MNTEAFTWRDGRLHAEEVSLEALARSVGTPFYCYSLSALHSAFGCYQSALAAMDTLIAYSVKSNPNLAVIKAFADRGAGADVVSLGELRRARAAGVPAQKIVFSGVGKTRTEMTSALQEGIGQFNAESLDEIRQLSALAEALGAQAPVAIRVNPDIAAGGHSKISTGKATDKFGLPVRAVPEAARLCHSLPGLRFAGLDMHIGSQISTLAPLRRAFAAMNDLMQVLAAQDMPVKRLDLGGGLGVTYGAEEALDMAAYASLVQDAFGGRGLALIVEPGRSLSAAAGVLVTEIVRIKETAGRTFLVVDAGMNDLMRPALYDVVHAVKPVIRRDGKTRLYDVVGPVCESTDIFLKQTALRPMRAGELLVFTMAGAYGASLASEYNTRPLAPEVMVSGKNWQIVRPRPSYEEILGRDRVPDWS